MRILFIGAVESSARMLEKLLAMKADVVGVCTKHVKEIHSDQRDLTLTCQKHSIPCVRVDDINSPESIAWIKAKSPEIILCFGWSSIIRRDLLELPRLGVIGFHPSTLPRNRGRHPLIWSLVLGLNEISSTFFFMSAGVDDGDIISQQKIHVSYSDNATTLYEKMIKTALQQLESLIPALERKTYNREQQNNAISNVWRKRGVADGKIDFRMSSLAIYNLVRALARPYCGAHVDYKGNHITIWKVEEVESDLINMEPGKILNVDKKGIVVKCYNNAVRLIEHEFSELPKEGEYL